MRRLVLTGHRAGDDILHWLDAHSVSLRQGLPADLLGRRWQQAGRPADELADALARLLDDDWVAITPDLQPPHLRLTASGYRRLIEAPEAAAEPPAEPPAEVPARAPADHAGPTAADAPATAAPVAVAAAPAATAPVAVAPVAVAAAVAAVPATATPAPARRPTELSLRNDILGVYRELRLQAGARLIGATLSRYWQEMGHRSADLRTGIDLLVRDGYLEPHLIGIDRHWMLTPGGAAYAYGPATAAALLDLAAPLDGIGPAPSAADLPRLAARVIVAELDGRDDALAYAALRPAWMQRTRLDDGALLFALDLLHKQQQIELTAGTALQIRLTAAGRLLATQDTPALGRFVHLLHRALGG